MSPSHSPAGVLIVDDSVPFRDVLRDIVAATPGLTWVGEAGSGEEALAAVERLAPHMVVMDKRMPGIGGIEAARRIAAQAPEVVVVLVSLETPQPDALARSGAAAFLHKRDLSPQVLGELWRTHGVS